MKINGYKPENPNEELVVIPRGDGKDIVFRVRAVLDETEFDQLCPMPTPPTIVRKDGSESKDVTDDKFKEKVRTWSKRKSDWLILTSLKVTEGLEWETVKMGEPDTWSNWFDELKDFKLTEAEIRIIIEAVQSVNSLDETKIEAARRRFLAFQEAQQGG